MLCRGVVHATQGADAHPSTLRIRFVDQHVDPGVDQAQRSPRTMDDTVNHTHNNVDHAQNHIDHSNTNVHNTKNGTHDDLIPAVSSTGGGQQDGQHADESHDNDTGTFAINISTSHQHHGQCVGQCVGQTCGEVRTSEKQMYMHVFTHTQHHLYTHTASFVRGKRVIVPSADVAMDTSSRHITAAGGGAAAAGGNVEHHHHHRDGNANIDHMTVDHMMVDHMTVDHMMVDHEQHKHDTPHLLPPTIQPRRHNTHRNTHHNITHASTHHNNVLLEHTTAPQLLPPTILLQAVVRYVPLYLVNTRRGASQEHVGGGGHGGGGNAQVCACLCVRCDRENVCGNTVCVVACETKTHSMM